MRKLHGFAPLFVPILFLSLVWPQEQPKFGWKKTGEEVFSLDAMETKYLRLPSGRLRFEFQAEDAVYAGVLAPQQYAAVSGKYLTLAAFRQFHCVRESIIETTADCNVGIANAVLAVRDKRGPITRAAGRLLYCKTGRWKRDLSGSCQQTQQGEK
jgi:hypothetical protein